MRAYLEWCRRYDNQGQVMRLSHAVSLLLPPPYALHKSPATLTVQSHRILLLLHLLLLRCWLDGLIFVSSVRNVSLSVNVVWLLSVRLVSVILSLRLLTCRCIC